MTSSPVRPPAAASGQFDHPGLLYRGTGQYLAGTTAFVHSALTAGDAVLVAVPGPNLDLIRDALVDVGDRVEFADMAVAGRNPGRIIPGVLLTFSAAHPRQRVSIIGEPIWPGRTDIEYPACAIHEALINAVFAGRDAAILCPYDAANLGAAALDDARRNHPTMIEDGVHEPSAQYTDPFATAARYNVSLPALPPDADTMHYDSESALSAVRRFVVRHAISAGLSGDRVDDMIVAVNELTANTIEHTSGAGRVTIWAEPGFLVCQVDDRGHLVDPLVGRMVPSAQAVGGRGILLANYLCDLVRIHTSDEGTSIRLHMWL